MPLSLVTPPTSEPFADASLPKLQLRLTGTDHDAFLTSLAIPAARERAEQATRRQLITATWDLLLDHFPSWAGVLELPLPPLQSVTWVKYYDTAGVLRTLDASLYTVQAPAGPRCARGRVAPVEGEVWPDTRAQVGAVWVRFVAGYGASGATVPPRLQMAMLQDIGSLFEFREALQARGADAVEIPGGASAVYASFVSRPRWATLEAVGA